MTYCFIIAIFVTFSRHQSPADIYLAPYVRESVSAYTRALSPESAWAMIDSMTPDCQQHIINNLGTQEMMEDEWSWRWRDLCKLADGRSSSQTLIPFMTATQAASYEHMHMYAC